MKAKLILSFALFFCLNILYGNQKNHYLSPGKETSLSGNYKIYSLNISHNINKETLVTGGFSGKITANKDSIKSNNSRTGFLGLKNKNGEWKWIKKIKGNGFNQINNSIEYNNGWLITGVFSDTINTGNKNILISKSYQNTFIMKIDNNGKIIWATSFDMIPNGKKQFLINNNNENEYYFATEFNGKFVYNETVFDSGNSTALIIAKISENNKISDITLINSESSINTKGIRLFNNKILVAGNFTNKINIGNKTIRNSGNKDFFAAIYDESLNIKKVKKSEGYGAKKISGIVAYNDKILLFGTYNGSFLWDNDLFESSKHGNDIFIIKLDKNMNFLWKEDISGESHKNIKNIILGKDGQIYILANYKGNLMFNGEAYTTESYHFEWIITKYTNKGEAEWLMSANNEYNLNANITSGVNNGELIFYSINREEGRGHLFDKNVKLEAKRKNSILLFDCTYAEKPKLPTDTIFYNSGIINTKNLFTDNWKCISEKQNLKINESSYIKVRAINNYGCILEDSLYVEIMPELSLASSCHFEEEKSYIKHSKKDNFTSEKDKTNCGFNIFPNPGSEAFTVELSDTDRGIFSVSSDLDKDITIAITDMQGNMIFRDKKTIEGYYLHKHNLEPGSYLVLIKIGNNFCGSKILIVK